MVGRALARWQVSDDDAEAAVAVVVAATAGRKLAIA